MKLFLYFSQIIGMDIFDSQGQWVGRLHDIAMNPNADIYPKASDLILRTGSCAREYARVSWEDVTYYRRRISVLRSPGADQILQ